MATAGEDEGCERANAAKLERARERDYTGMRPENIWDMVKPGSFWRSLPGTSLNEKGPEKGRR